MTCHSVLKLLGRIAAAQSIDETWSVATSHFATLGLGRAHYGFTRFRHLRTIGDPDDALFLSTCDADQARRWFESGLSGRMPVFRWGGSGICAWKAADAPEIHEDLRAGISISFPEASSRARGALGLSADHDDVERIFAARRDEIIAVAHMMHLRIVQLPQLTRTRALSPRQREALEWVADGKTTQDVALLMGVSPAMVEKHLRLARDALAVETTAQAVAKGALLNMIFQQFPEHRIQAAS
ncbi:helix-turn-helix transcriptional regulator [Pseudogemmobacter humi]|uniref:Sigma-70, region 4 n=1 Tax=Pseudogemmobacter humi TaxID=2483812 RepID=A0A3P5XAS1_9RHOB|nr:sigma factor-like helix-turn-helix DNA-binding protein [Pseudogemmobacter humi]VDC31848.1 Sigma-70, region 4 [Pseudogemmobacter humi]